MNKIRIIDLLNKISRGEEVPKKIRFDNINWNKVYGEKYMYYKNDYDCDFFLYFFRKNLDFTLNDEVEIIEEDKKIEKLKIVENGSINSYALLDKNGTKCALTKHSKEIADKINEIIDYINKGDK